MPISVHFGGCKSFIFPRLELAPHEIGSERTVSDNVQRLQHTFALNAEIKMESEHDVGRLPRSSFAKTVHTVEVDSIRGA